LTEISYVVGDATLPQSAKTTIICHSCNDIGAWGAGFVVPLGQKYPEAREKYLEWSGRAPSNIGAITTPFKLGEVQFVKINPQLWIANLIGQKGVGFRNGPPVKYDALYDGFVKVADFAVSQSAEVVMPRIGCGLGGGDWNVVEKLINQTLIRKGVSVIVCDLPQPKKEIDAEPTFGW
jgi:O-acetyl-ADP-ribose deacetylase (regulator of RNase III)